MYLGKQGRCRPREADSLPSVTKFGGERGRHGTSFCYAVFVIGTFCLKSIDWNGGGD